MALSLDGECYRVITAQLPRGTAGADPAIGLFGGRFASPMHIAVVRLGMARFALVHPGARLCVANGRRRFRSRPQFGSMLLHRCGLGRIGTFRDSLNQVLRECRACHGDQYPSYQKR